MGTRRTRVARLRLTRSVQVFLGAALVAGCASQRPVPDAPPAARAPAPASDDGAGPIRCTLEGFTPSRLTGEAELPELDRWSIPAALPGTSKENPIRRCGHDDSYRFVAEVFRCADGKNPLGGDKLAAMRSRRGNVGDSGDRHIIDVYELPCPGGPEQVFVDLYACPEHDPNAPPPRPQTPRAQRMREPLPPEADGLARSALELAAQHRTRAAIEKAEQAMTRARAILGADHPAIVPLYSLLALFHTRDGQPDKAARMWVTAYRTLQDSDWPQTSFAATVLLELGQQASARNEHALAACLLQRAVAGKQETDGIYDDALSAALSLLAAAEVELKHGAQVERLLKRAFRLHEMSAGPRSTEAAPMLNLLAQIYAAIGDEASAAAVQARLRLVPATPAP